ncbi:cyclase family protein [Knoellia sp. S7-12]|uniref:cyclase family protein n=1 Tax=Knoellia sp. S7-12 TaxID=3126698 RepID=UPI003366B7FC
MSTGRTADGAVVTVVDLAQPVHPGVPTSPNHPGYRHSLLRRHGDAVRVDGTSGANDLLVMGTHTATHLDALAHISHDGLLHGRVSAAQAQAGGRFLDHGVHTVDPIVTTGYLLDVPAVLGVDRLAPGHAVTVAELSQALGDRRPAPGAGLLVRTGWAQLWDAPAAFLDHDGGVPGPDEEGVAWLASHRPCVVGSDTTAFEHIPGGAGHARLPGHRILLVENGIPILEMLDLEQLARAGTKAFTLVAAPLRLVGATGSPLRPIAILH